jgi:hypothetical protein
MSSDKNVTYVSNCSANLKNPVTKQELHDAKKAFIKDHMIAVAVGDLEVMRIPLATMKMGKVIVEEGISNFHLGPIIFSGRTRSSNSSAVMRLSSRHTSFRVLFS